MSTQIPNFKDYVNEVHRVFERYSSLDDQTEYKNSIKVHGRYENIIDSVGKVTQQMPFEAKQQALEAAIEIAKFVCIQGDRSIIGKSMRESFPWMPFHSTVSHILDMLLPEELAAIQADGEIPKAFRSLRWNFQEYALDLRIDDCIDRLWLDESDQEDDVQMAL